MSGSTDPLASYGDLLPLAWHVKGERTAAAPHLLGLVKLGTKLVRVCSSGLKALLCGRQPLFQLPEVPLHIPGKAASAFSTMQHPSIDRVDHSVSLRTAKAPTGSRVLYWMTCKCIKQVTEH